MRWLSLVFWQTSPSCCDQKSGQMMISERICVLFTHKVQKRPACGMTLVTDPCKLWISLIKGGKERFARRKLRESFRGSNPSSFDQQMLWIWELWKMPKIVNHYIGSSWILALAHLFLFPLKWSIRRGYHLYPSACLTTFSWERWHLLGFTVSFLQSILQLCLCKRCAAMTGEAVAGKVKVSVTLLT